MRHMTTTRFFRFPLLWVACAAAAVAVIGWAGSTLAQSTEDTKESGPEVLALKFHADWCGKCQAMGPAFQNLSKKYDTAPVLFHVFDQTEKADQRQARYMAHALELGEIWQKRGGSTGFILLVDADTHKTIDVLKHDQGFKAMGKDLDQAIEQAESS